jgi:F420-0:gamma-glutamyl ligase-like protein
LARTYKCLAIETGYWRPGTDYVQRIAESINGKIKNGDFVTISEKAISTASGNIVDESTIHPTKMTSLIAKYWMRHIWGHPLGILCHLKRKTAMRLREYPPTEGAAHKQVALNNAGFWQALLHGSEGGIDGSNLPYSYVSLPLKNPQQIAKNVQAQIKKELHKDIAVMILDTDKTYSFRNFHFTPRPKPIEGIHAFNGLVTYLAGHFFKFKRRATPLGLAGSRIGVDEALGIADLANRARGFGAGRNVWDMAEAFHVYLTEVSWDMLDKVKHTPIVIVRRVKSNKTKIGTTFR